jgi:hypothetical protein
MREEHVGGRLHDSSSLNLREHPLAIPAVLTVHLQITHFNVEKCNVFLVHASTGYRELELQLHSFLNWALARCWWLPSHPCRFTAEKEQQCPLKRVLFRPCRVVVLPAMRRRLFHAHG